MLHIWPPGFLAFGPAALLTLRPRLAACRIFGHLAVWPAIFLAIWRLGLLYFWRFGLLGFRPFFAFFLLHFSTVGAFDLRHFFSIGIYARGIFGRFACCIKASRPLCLLQLCCVLY
jgi:hypothetical protein